MKTANDRKKEQAAGLLFLVATAAYLTGSGWIGGTLGQSDFLVHLSSESSKIRIGLFLETINSAAVIAISVLLFPILKRYSETTAVGYLSARIVEAVLLTIGIGLVFALLDWSGSAAENALQPAAQTVGDLAAAVQTMTFQLAMLSLGLGSLAFCWLLYRERLVPRLLAGLGIIGYIALTLSSCFSLAGLEPGALLFIPGAVFEIVFPVWLIVRGLDTGRTK
ncbi:DUF4386 domain-containing protein [Saccharibacillus deserti]|uniref:DUF4386 domain-containing protein n=1 Tax=Saccharibacillus deserti TaxID=1634444 RepID=UPI0015575118|nr:DUF4386 domain-containing protein [Saccharibacillus deserti]